MNGDFRDGYCSLPMSNSPSARASAAICYLDAAARRRGNLTILSRANVLHLLLEGAAPSACARWLTAKKREFLAREMILCGGAHLSRPRC